MEKVSKKQILLIVLVLICSLGLTYAFYGALIGPVAKTSTDVISGTNDRLVFNQNGTLNFTLNQNDMQSGSGNVSNSNTPSATLFANSGNNTASSTYNVYFEITSNDFVRSNGRTPEVLIKIFNPNGVEITSIVGLDYATINRTSGFDITTKTGVFTITENYEITSNDSNVGVTQNWTFTLVGLNLTIDQSANIGHTIEANVKLQQNTLFEEQTFSYTGEAQEFTVPATGNYKIELWGAGNNYSSNSHGAGGYTSGIISLNENEKLYIYVGGVNSAFNSGETGDITVHTGNGATDIRYFDNNNITNENLVWNNSLGLNSRIMVAGAGGIGNGSNIGDTSGVAVIQGELGYAGGLTGYLGNTGYHSSYANSYVVYSGQPGTQTAGGTGGNSGNFADSTGQSGTFGSGGAGGNCSPAMSGYSCNVGSKGFNGSGGYYGSGGSGGYLPGWWSAFGTAGGSSFISGHAGCIAIASGSTSEPRAIKSGCTSTSNTIECATHYSNKVFTNTKMIDGGGYAWTTIKGSQEQMPNPTGGFYDLGIGHSGNGYAKITLID